MVIRNVLHDSWNMPLQGVEHIVNGTMQNRFVISIVRNIRTYIFRITQLDKDFFLYAMRNMPVCQGKKTPTKQLCRTLEST